MATTFQTSDKKEEKINAYYFRKEFKPTEDVLMYSEAGTKNFISFENGFVETVRLAYSNHYSLVLKPDDVWLAIMVQFAHYMVKYGEDLRDKFVAHAGQKELTVAMIGTLRNADYSKFCMLMTNAIAKNIKDSSVRDWAMPDFSTTTFKEKVVGAAVLMATMKKYFSYKCCLSCGIPSVTLLGTVEDWEKLQQKANRLLEFDCKEGLMAKWYALLSPILEQFVKSKRGEPNLEWWSRVCSNHGMGSGPSYMSGWITVFNVFDIDGNWRGDQRFVRTWNDIDCQSKCEFAPEGWPVIDSSEVSSGVVKVDVTVDDNGTEYKCELISGHKGAVAMNETTLQPQVEVGLYLKTESK